MRCQPDLSTVSTVAFLVQPLTSKHLGPSYLHTVVYDSEGNAMRQNYHAVHSADSPNFNTDRVEAQLVLARDPASRLQVGFQNVQAVSKEPQG